MSLRQSRSYRFLLVLASLLCLVGAGYLAYKTFFSSGGTEKELAAAETAYARGSEAFAAKNWNEATRKFDESRLLCDKALDSLDKMTKTGKTPVEDMKKWNGQIMWVKARAIRDFFYAKAQQDGKPIDEVTDGTTGEKFRAYNAIPDDAARKDSNTCLLVAADLLRDDPEIVKDALRTELSRQPLVWRYVEPLCKATVEKNPKDPRAQYFLAKFEYDQPNNDTGVPTPFDKKATDRVEKARDHLAMAKANGAPFWRTVHLEAQILYWLSKSPTRRAKPAEIAELNKQLDKLLFDAQDGAVALAARGAKMSPLSSYDAQGLIGVQAIAMERAVDEARKPNGNPATVRVVADAALAVADKVADDPVAKAYLADATAGMIEVVAGAQMFLARSDPRGWRDLQDAMQAFLAKKAGTSIEDRPAVRLQLAAIAQRDSTLAAKAGDSVRAKELNALALKQAEEGLKAAETSKLPTPVVDEFHAVVAEWKILNAVKAEAVEPNIARLRTSLNPKLKLIGQFLDAVIAERQGKLDVARRLIEPITRDKNKDHEDVVFRANMMLGSLALATGDVRTALTALKAVEPMYVKLDDLNPIDRAWAGEFVRSLDEILALQAVAHFELGLQAINQYRKANPNKTVPGELTAADETSAVGLIKKLRVPSSGDRMARLTMVNYLAATGRRDLAEELVNKLMGDYTDSVDVLRTQVTLMAMPKDPKEAKLDPNGLAKADIRISKFLKDYPGDRGGKLFYAEWLVRTGRADKAVEYLRDPLTFPGGRDAVAERVLAGALLQAGKGAEAQQILSRLPADPVVDAILVRAATTRDASEKQLRDALGRHENQGLFRIYDATMRLGEGKYEEAARGYISAIEFTAARAAARAGLQRALMAYADADPTKAREFITQIGQEFPDEPGVYLAGAIAAMNLDDIGTPSDSWDQTKSMLAGLNRWEDKVTKQGTSKADATMVKATFKLLMGDADGARRDALVSLPQNPNHVPTLILLADLALAPPGDPARAKDYYDQLVKLNPAEPRLPYIEARMKEQSQDWAGAIAIYEKQLADSPRNAVPFPLLVEAQVKAGKKDDALRTCRDWYARFPDDTRAIASLIKHLCESGGKAEAVKLANDFVTRQVEEARKAVTTTNPLPPAEGDKVVENVRFGAIYHAAGGFYRGKDFNESEARVGEILKARPDDTGALLLASDIAIAKQEWDKAIPYYQTLLAKNPRAFVAGNNLAWILAAKKNDPAKALAVVDEVRKGRGVNPIAAERLPADFLDTLGLVYVKLNNPGRFIEMRQTFEGAVKRYPTDARMALYLAHAYALTGEKTRAMEAFDLAIKLADPKNGLSTEQIKDVIDAAEEAKKKLRG